MKITKIMSDDVITVEPINDLATVAQLMKKHNIGFMPIVFDGQLLGVVTDRDLAIRGYGNKRDAGTKITEIMTSDCITVNNSTSVDEVSEIMAKNNIRRVCITDNGHLVGVCALGDLAVRKDYRENAEKVLTDISHK
ncbi:MAG: CBS domain-containing protein [Clostridia bacterium]